jgi:putative membrane protein
MMYGYGTGWGWMMLMPFVLIVLLGVVIWAVVRLVQRSGDHQQSAGACRETPQETLDRRFASGEIDADAYTQTRTRLAGREPSSPCNLRQPVGEQDPHHPCLGSQTQGRVVSHPDQHFVG